MNHDQLRTLIIVVLIIVPFWASLAIAIRTDTRPAVHRATPEKTITPAVIAFHMAMANDHQHLADEALCPAECARHLALVRHYSSHAVDAAERHPEMLEEAHDLYTTYKNRNQP